MRILKVMVSVITCMAIACTIILTCGFEKVLASTWDNAYTFYQMYANNAVFNPCSDTDGYIYCATKGNKSNSKIKYKTVGWKMTFVDENNSNLQVLYFKCKGQYLAHKNTCIVDGYEYELYALKLSKLKSRLKAQTKDKMASGNCRMILDACMVVSKRGVAGGSIDDSGNKNGNVYTDYDGIVNAENWSQAAKVALQTYFNKQVLNLFYNVTISSGVGIRSVSGAGIYCYGTRVTVSAEIKDGYTFNGWEGAQNNDLSYSFRINRNMSFIVSADLISVKIKYFRNFSASDSTKKEQLMFYKAKEQDFNVCEWKKEGYVFGGWMKSRDGRVEYEEGQTVNANWIKNNSPSVNLFAKWNANRYIFRFECDFDEEESEEIGAAYNERIRFPSIDGVIGWKLVTENYSAEYECGRNYRVKQIVRDLGLTDVFGATITLYAKRESFPNICAGDLYYSLDDAKAGRITEQEISSHARAFDEIDGEITYGRNSTTSFKLTNYRANRFCNMQSGGVIRLKFKAKNSTNKVVEKEIDVHVIEIISKKSDDNIKRIRFIDKKYLEKPEGGFVDENAGGLRSDSCWINSNQYYRILKNALEF